MTDKAICRNDGRCEYAIQSGAEGNGHCPNGKCAMPHSAPGTGSDTLDCILGVGGFASFGPLDAQPAAHLTIPGALEWDGDNGTHGADGESRAHGEPEQAEKPAAFEISSYGGRVERFVVREDVATEIYDKRVADGAEDVRVRALFARSNAAEVAQLRAQLANTEQSRRSFFDLSQDLEKRLADRDALLQMFIDNSDDGDVVELSRNALSASAEPARCERCQGHGVIGWTTGQTPESFNQGEAPCQDCLATGYAHSNGMPVPGTCETCKGAGVVDDGELTHSEGGIPYAMGPIKCVKDCPDCSDQAAKGGDDE